jgi:hypothetical protein
MSSPLSRHWVSDEEMVEAYVLHKIDKEEFSDLTAHLGECEDCRKRVQEERELQEGIRKFGRREMKRRLKSQVRRDRSRRIEWTHVASIAAALIVVFSAVLTVRWFFDFKKEKTHVREIVLQENRPAERAIWIIGKVVALKERSDSHTPSQTPTPLMANNELETSELAYSEREASQKSSPESIADRNKAETFASKKSLAASSEKKTDVRDVDNLKSMEAPTPTAIKETEPRSEISSSAFKSAKSLAKQISNSQDSLNSKARGGTTLASEDNLVSRIGNDSRGKQFSAPTIERKAEAYKPAPAKLKSYSVRTSKRTMKDKNAIVVLVHRGDMNDLPVSMKGGDASIIHTRLERTPQGILLTFYSTTITDSVATNIETIGQDSIIVTLRNRQIVYHIPEGWAGKM